MPLAPPQLAPLANGLFSGTHAAATTLTLDAKRMRIRSVITTAAPDRAGDVVVPAGLRDAEEYLLNPVVLWAHNRTQFPPIGACEWLDVQPTRVVAETRFAQGVRLAEDVFRLYEQGILRGWSIGFMPRRTTKAAPRPGGPGASGGLDGKVGLRIDEWDLVEYSAVPIPENPGALTVALQKGLVKDPALRDWLRQLPDDRGGRVVPVGDVLAALCPPPARSA